MLRILLVAPALIAMLVACQPVANPVPDEPAPGDDACGASAYQDLVGQDARLLAAMTFPAPMRVIRPGEAVTMDFAPNRLNVEVDEQERISRVYCG